MSGLSVPTTAKLPSKLRVPSSSPAVLKNLIHVSREGLIMLALDWLEDSALENSMPYLVDRDDDQEEDIDDIYPPCRSIEELRQLYQDLQEQRGSRRDVANRILEGDWRHGLTLYQLAMVDFTYLDEHPMSQTWQAYQIRSLAAPTEEVQDEADLKIDRKSLEVPRFHPSTFLQNLQDQVLPDMKAHYQFHRPLSSAIMLLRMFIVSSPYNSSLALSGPDSGNGVNFDAARTLYLAFPDGSPSIFISKSSGIGASAVGESRGLNKLVTDGVPKALSRPRQRFALSSLGLVTRNIDALLDKRGPGRGNAAGGGWSIYADQKKRTSPLDTVLPSPPLSRGSTGSNQSRKRQQPMTKGQQQAKRAKLIAEARFGHSGVVTDGKGIEKFEVVIEDPYPDVEMAPEDEDEALLADRRTGAHRKSHIDTTLSRARAQGGGEGDEEDDPTGWAPAVEIAFAGAHVFAGIRQLVEAGIIDGERMPGWMTGEDGVTIATIRNGRIRGHKGSGL